MWRADPQPLLFTAFSAILNLPLKSRPVYPPAGIVKRPFTGTENRIYVAQVSYPVFTAYCSANTLPTPQPDSKPCKIYKYACNTGSRWEIQPQLHVSILSPI